MATKTPNLNTIIRRAYTLNGQSITNDWHLAEQCAALTGSSEDVAQTILAAFANQRKDNEPEVAITATKVRQLIAAWRAFGSVIDKVQVLHAPTTVYQATSGRKFENDAARVEALSTVPALLKERRANKHKSAHNGAKTRKANVADAPEWEKALTRLTDLAKSHKVAPHAMLTALLDAYEEAQGK